MRGTVAKRIRRAVYGEQAFRRDNRSTPIREYNEKGKLVKFLAKIIQPNENKMFTLDRKYKEAKRLHKEGVLKCQKTRKNQNTKSMY